MAPSRVLFRAAWLASILLLPTAAHATNPYEQEILGKWEIEGETDLFVFEADNVCYRMDEDGVLTSEKGRWSATADHMTIEVKYNGKRFRSVFRYTRAEGGGFQLEIERALVDGQPKEVKRKKLTAKRWKAR